MKKEVKRYFSEKETLSIFVVVAIAIVLAVTSTNITGNQTSNLPYGNCYANGSTTCINSYYYQCLWSSNLSRLAWQYRQCNGVCQNNNCVSTQVPTCIDSDGGKNYYKKGIVTASNQNSNWNSFNVEDVCDLKFDSSGNTLAESICEQRTDGYYYPLQTHAYCQYGCSQGACLSAPVVTITNVTTQIYPTNQSTTSLNNVSVSGNINQNNITNTTRMSSLNFSNVTIISNVSNVTFTNVTQRTFEQNITTNVTNNATAKNQTKQISDTANLTNTTTQLTNITSTICTEGWKCYSTSQLGYQYNNCRWYTPLTNCQYGCANNFCQTAPVTNATPQNDTMANITSTNMTEESITVANITNITIEEVIVQNVSEVNQTFVNVTTNISINVTTNITNETTPTENISTNITAPANVSNITEIITSENITTIVRTLENVSYNISGNITKNISINLTKRINISRNATNITARIKEIKPNVFVRIFKWFFGWF